MDLRDTGGWYIRTGRPPGGRASAGRLLRILTVHLRAATSCIRSELRYNSEKPADPITVYVYRSDGRLTWYEDDARRRYEKKALARLPHRTARQTLSLGQQTRHIPGMLENAPYK